eukprot:Nk52_evm16s256 gene=Nk52_evmTU16s256
MDPCWTLIHERPYEVDFIINFFITALNSSKEELIKPFPQPFVREVAGPGGREIRQKLTERLGVAAEGIASVEQLYQSGKKGSGPEGILSEDSLELLQWLLIARCRNSVPLSVGSVKLGIKVIAKGEKEKVFKGICSRGIVSGNSATPDYIVQVVKEGVGAVELQTEFEAHEEKYGSMLAFHGTSSSRIWSILHYGLCSHMSERALFGEGVYLSRDITTAYSFTDVCEGWRLSNLAPCTRTVLVCSVAMHPSLARFNTDEVEGNLSTARPSAGSVRKRVSGISFESSESFVPDTYIIARSNTVVSVRYILVYGGANQRSGSTSSPGNGNGTGTPPRSGGTRSSLWRGNEAPTAEEDTVSRAVMAALRYFLWEYKLFLFIALYLAILCLAGMPHRAPSSSSSLFHPSN